MDYQEKLQTILTRHEELTQLLTTEMDTQKIIQLSKEKDILPSVTTWMNLEDNMLNGISQSRKDSIA